MEKKIAKFTPVQTHKKSTIDLTKIRQRKILNISRSHLTRLISIITGFNFLSYIQFNANPEINPLCKLCGKENETLCHFVTECPRLKTYRDKTFLDTPPQQDSWKISQIVQFSTYPTIYNLMSICLPFVDCPWKGVSNWAWGRGPLRGPISQPHGYHRSHVMHAGSYLYLTAFCSQLYSRKLRVNINLR